MNSTSNAESKKFLLTIMNPTETQISDRSLLPAPGFPKRNV